MKQQKKYKSRGRNICNMQYFYFYAKNRIKIEKILLSNILNEIFFKLNTLFNVIFYILIYIERKLRAKFIISKNNCWTV